MQTKIVLCLAFVIIRLPNINAITACPGKNITQGNCSGPIDYFLCQCTTSNITIDIHLSPGCYYIKDQPSCVIQNKSSIKLTGNSSNDTFIKCKEPFNIVFVNVQGVIISNITMVNCGNVVDDTINEAVNDTTNNDGHFGPGFRLAIMLYQVTDVAISDFTMNGTLGYGIVTFNVIGTMTIFKLKIENTTFENDRGSKCNEYNYNSSTANFTCTGSGIFIIYYNNTESSSINETNTTLLIDQSYFITNKNLLPYEQFRILVDAINTGFFRTSIPLQGAAGITIFYLQGSYDVNATISNSFFHNNNGTLSGSIALGSLSTIRGKTLIQNCVFKGNNRMNRSIPIPSISRGDSGGISFYHLSLINRNMNYNYYNNDSDMAEILTVTHCNFTKLGGTLGAAFHIQKISIGTTPLLIRIEYCNFNENEANSGSAVYAVDRRFDPTLSNGLIIKLLNVNAEHNTLLPGTTTDYVSSVFITGIFHSETCHFKFDCNEHCIIFQTTSHQFSLVILLLLQYQAM